ncbi:MAG: M48 family peptidase [Actinomycetota bacterium]|nr:MAG: M48 family peptidase [Actinomycetota bacterium]
MNSRFKILDSNPGIFWLIITLSGLALAVAIIILIVNLAVKPSYGPDTLKYFNSDFLSRASEYSRVSITLSIIGRVLSWLIMGITVWIAWKYFAAAPKISVLAAVGYIALFYIVLSIIILPLSFYRGYTIEHQFGQSVQTVGMWFSDYGKSKAIDIAISIGAMTGIYALMVYVPRYWWLIAASAMAVFIIIAVYLYPILIDPLFYKFKKLDDNKLQEKILEVTEKAGIEVEEILVADASRRTVKANAYFTGIGNTRRIVLYDNLLDNFSSEEILNVVAHEAGHWKYLHILKSIGMSVAGGFLGLFILRLIFSRTGLTGDFRAIFTLIFITAAATFLIMPFQNMVSRYFEKQADGIALEFTRGYDTQVSLMVRLAESNLSNVDPYPIIRYILYSHPPIMERIIYAEEEGKK